MDDPQRSSMKCHATEPTVDIEHRRHILWGCVGVTTERPEGIAAVNQHIAERHRRRETQNVEAPVCCGPQAAREGGHRLSSELSGHLADCPVRQGAVAQNISQHGQLRGLGQMDQVPNDIANPPTCAPRRGIPRLWLEFVDLLSKLASQSLHFRPDRAGRAGRAVHAAIMRGQSAPWPIWH